MRIAIAGGTGTLGRLAAAELAGRGHEIRILSRRSQEYPVDLVTGNGLAAALDGCEVVVDASNASSPRRAARVLVEGSGRLIAAAAAGGVRHHVGISIVGCERVALGYYRVKVAQEQIIEQGPVPWSLIRATQFHELAAAALAAAAKFGVLPVPEMIVQTVAAAEVAAAVADAAESEPRRQRAQIGGPEIISAAALARTWRSVTGRHPVMIRFPVPGPLGRALKDGALTTAKPDIRGIVTFAEWLSERSRPSR
jgi:uncharacterized protein YbjT (DUF2867 family)